MTPQFRSRCVALVLMAGTLIPAPLTYAVDPEPGAGQRRADTWSGELAGRKAGEGRVRPGRAPLAPPSFSLLEAAEDTAHKPAPVPPTAAPPTPSATPPAALATPTPSRSPSGVSAIGPGRSVTGSPETGIHVMALGLGLALVGLGLAFLGVRLRRD